MKKKILVFLVIIILVITIAFVISEKAKITVKDGSSNEISVEKLKIKTIGNDKFAFKSLSNDIIEIGAETHSPAIPYVKLNKWNGEAFLKIDVPYVEGDKPNRFEDNEVVWSNNKYDITFYPKEPEEISEIDSKGNKRTFTINDEGGVEFDLILKEKPKTNLFIFPIQTNGLKFYYQPELTQEEIDQGAFRPENVVGSYAVYHESKSGDYTELGGKNYKTGKAFHIYRPKVYDADGDWIWGELDIDEEKGVLTVIVDESWMKNAVYPVVIDPDFGYTTLGASEFALFADKISLRIGNPGEDGTAISISFGARLLTGNSADWQGGLYDENLDLLSPQTETGVISSSTKQWWTLNFTNGPDVSNADFYAAAFMNYSTTDRIANAYDTGGVSGDSKYNGSDFTYNNWPSTFSGSNSVNRYSIYCTYGLLAAPSVTTNPATLVEETTATLNGNVTDDGGGAITERGFYCDTDEDPSTKYAVSGTTGAYTKDLISLSANTKYYFKAFATNSEGTSYGDILDFTTLGTGNNVPTISSVVDSPDPLVVSNDITFSVDWNDADAEGIKMYICKAADGGASGCGAGGTWCSNSNDYDLADPVVCSYTTQSGDAGSQNYYAYVCDDEPECSSPFSGSFTVQSFPSLPCEDHNIWGWGWSENIGWISFSCRNTKNVGEGVDYGIDVNETTGVFSGYAWAGGGKDFDSSSVPAIGWIKFDPVGPYPGPPNYSACLDLSGSGQDCDGVGDNMVSGWARALSPAGEPLQVTGGWDGWIKLKGTTQESNPYGVVFDIDNKEFQGWASGGDDNSEEAVIGWISFNCEDGGYSESSPEEYFSFITGETSDGYIRGYSTNYSTAHSTSDYFDITRSTINLGQEYEDGGCNGTPDSCSSFDSNQAGCNAQAGCGSWYSDCPGTADACSNLDSSQAVCEAQAGCTWNGCGGSAVPCYEWCYVEADCIAQSGCVWDPDCFGVPETCDSHYNEAECFDHPDCVWADGCFGTPTPCDTWDHTDQATCQSHPACNWISDIQECYPEPWECWIHANSSDCIYAGCTWGICSGTPKACPTWQTYAECQIAGCAWDIYSCDGPDNCSDFNEVDCGNREDCVWDGCSGTATACSSFDSNQSGCDAQAGCGGWYSDCPGTADACSSFGSEFSCEDQSGCSWDDEGFRVYRDYLVFDTSGVPDDAVITDVKLSLKTAWDESDDDFNVEIWKFDWAEPITSGNRESNYDAGGAVYDADWRNTSGISTGVYYDSSSLDNSWINKTGDTKYQLRSSRDVNDDEPDEDEYIALYSADSAGNEPILKVTYTLESGSPGEHYDVCTDSDYKVETTLDQSPNKPTGLNESWIGCGGIPQVALRTSLVLNWSYSDPEGDPQEGYEIWIDQTSNFSGPKFNNIVDPSSASSYTVDLTADDEGDWLNPPPLPGGLVWANTYWWKVKTKDDTGSWSDFSDPKSFTLPNRASPNVAFTPNPANPEVDEEVVFTDESICYLSDDSEYDCDTGGGEITYEWDFDYIGVMDNIDTTKGDTVHTYPAVGKYTARLQVTDSGIGLGLGMCYKEEDIGLPLPTWKEITPF